MIDTARSAQTATWPGPSVDPRRWTNRDVQVHLKPEGWQHGPQRGQQRKLTTSQLQSMLEQMNSMNDSGEFQEVESNHSGRLSHVPSQPEAIPSSSSMLSRDKSVPFFDAWDSLGLQENFFGNQFSTYGSPGNHSQGIHYGVAHKTPRETESVPRAIGTGTSFAREMTSKIEAQFQCRCLRLGR